MANENIKVIADKEDIVAIADKVRTLDGTTSEYELGELVTSIDAANADLDSQSALIAQIQSALEGKASSGGGTSVETCTVTLTRGNTANDTSSTIESFAYTGFNNGVIQSNYVSNNNNTIVTLTNVIKHSLIAVCVEWADQEKLTNTTSIFKFDGGRVYSIDEDNVSIHIYSCFIKGTKIMLADGTTKEIQDITYDDELLVWDFDNGCYSSAKPLWIKKEETALSYHHCVFENGIELDLVGSDGNCHAVFCLDDNKFEYANNCVGKMVMTLWGATKLLSCEKKYETVEFYNVITNYHMNCYANDVLTSTKMNNIYPIENMKFVKDDRETVLYEAYPEIPIEFYKGLRLGENKPEKIDELTNKVKKLISIQK